MARTTLRALADADAVVVPAGSCAAMMRLHWPALFEGAERKLARTVAGRVFELSQYLVDELGVTAIGSPGDLTVAYHDSCHMLRELRVHDQPRTLLRSVATLVELPRSERCCGFGGTFSVRYPEVSTAMADDKLGAAETAGIELIASADPGCAMQLGGRGVAHRAPVDGRASGNRAGQGAVSNFTTRSHERLGDPARRTALAKMTDRQSDARVRVTTDDIPDFDALRDRGAAIRDEAIQNLPRYLDQLVASFERNGVVVHRAASAAEAIDIVSGIAARYGGPVVKGKSMLSEEIGLNERLEADGLEVFETDLGEFIIQLAGEPPEHILAPAIHWSRERVRKLFEPLAGRPLGDDPAELVAFARGHLRARFESAKVGITGVNFGVAETGTVVVVSNEGNGRLSAAMPPVHIALMGIERVVPRLDDLGVLLPLLTRSATGQKLS